MIKDNMAYIYIKGIFIFILIINHSSFTFAMNFSTPKFSMKEKDKYERNDINTTTLTFNGTTSTVNRIDDLDSKTNSEFNISTRNPLVFLNASTFTTTPTRLRSTDGMLTMKNNITVGNDNPSITKDGAVMSNTNQTDIEDTTLDGSSMTRNSTKNSDKFSDHNNDNNNQTNFPVIPLIGKRNVRFTSTSLKMQNISSIHNISMANYKHMPPTSVKINTTHNIHSYKETDNATILLHDLKFTNLLQSSDVITTTAFGGKEPYSESKIGNSSDSFFDLNDEAFASTVATNVKTNENSTNKNTSNLYTTSSSKTNEIVTLNAPYNNPSERNLNSSRNMSTIFNVASHSDLHDLKLQNSISVNVSAMKNNNEVVDIINSRQTEKSLTLSNSSNISIALVSTNKTTEIVLDSDHVHKIVTDMDLLDNSVIGNNKSNGTIETQITKSFEQPFKSHLNINPSYIGNSNKNSLNKTEKELVDDSQRHTDELKALINSKVGNLESDEYKYNISNITLSTPVSNRSFISNDILDRAIWRSDLSTTKVYTNNIMNKLRNNTKLISNKLSKQGRLNNSTALSESMPEMNISETKTPEHMYNSSSNTTLDTTENDFNSIIDKKSVSSNTTTTVKPTVSNTLTTTTSVINRSSTLPSKTRNLNKTEAIENSISSVVTENYNFTSSKRIISSIDQFVTTPQYLTPTLSPLSICRESSCVKAANDIRSSIGKNSCIDPEKFVCGNNGKGDYVDMPEDHSSWGLVEKTEQRYLGLVESLMSTDTYSNWKLLEAARHTYRQCLNTSEIEDSGNDIWKGMSEVLGGFPIAQRFWRESAYDWIITNAKISKRFEMGSLIKAKFDAEKKKYIHIELGESLLPMAELLNYSNSPPLLQAWINLFYQTIEELWLDVDSGNFTVIEPQRLVSQDNITISLDTLTPNNSVANSKEDSEVQQSDLMHVVNDHTSENAANAAFRSKRSFLWMLPNTKKGSKVPDRSYFDIQVNETINFEIQLASLIHHFSSTNSSTLSFSELLNKTEALPVIKDFAKLDFRKMLTNIFLKDDTPFHPENYTYVVIPSQLQELQILLSSYQPRDIANVFGWRVLQQLLPHMQHQFRKLKFEFDQVSDQITRVKKRSTFCSEMVLEYFPSVIGHILFDTINSRRTLHSVKKLRHEIRKGIKELLSSHEFKLNNFSVDVEEPEWILNRNVIEKRYRNLNVSSILTSNHHLSTFITLSSWKRRITLEKNAKISSLTKIERVTNLGRHSIFDMENGFIPHYLMKYPIFDPSTVYPINFAGIGFLMFQHAMNDITVNHPNCSMTNNISTFVQLFRNIDKFSSLKISLPNLQDLTQTQTMLIWFVKTWGCNIERENVLYHSDIHNMRQKLLKDAALIFKSYFDCDRPQFRDRPQFNIGNFLQKDDYLN